jgi:hypothetical protein
MNTFRATSPEGVITEYDAALPDPEHLTPGWRCEQIIIATASPDAPVEVDTRKYGGRRLLTKLEFIELLGDAAYQGVLTMAKASVQIEAWVKKMELTTPDADGYSVNLDDPRTQGGVTAIGMALEMQGIVTVDWVSEVLNG